MGRSGLRAAIAQAPLRRVRVRGVPATESAVDPLRVGLEAGPQLLVERVLLRRVRIRDVRLAAGEMDDHAGAALFLVLPHDLPADVTKRALSLPVVPLLAQREEFANSVLPHLHARDRAVHQILPNALERDVAVLPLGIGVPLPRERA